MRPRVCRVPLQRAHGTRQPVRALISPALKEHVDSLVQQHATQTYLTQKPLFRGHPVGAGWWESASFLAGEAPPPISRILSEEAAAGPRDGPSQPPETSGHANQGPISQVTGRLTSTPSH